MRLNRFYFLTPVPLSQTTTSLETLWDDPFLCAIFLSTSFSSETDPLFRVSPWRITHPTICNFLLAFLLLQCLLFIFQAAVNVWFLLIFMNTPMFSLFPQMPFLRPSHKRIRDQDPRPDATRMDSMNDRLIWVHIITRHGIYEYVGGHFRAFSFRMIVMKSLNSTLLTMMLVSRFIEHRPLVMHVLCNNSKEWMPMKCLTASQCPFLVESS